MSQNITESPRIKLVAFGGNMVGCDYSERRIKTPVARCKCKIRPSLTTSKEGLKRINIRIARQQGFNSGFGWSL